MKATINLEFTDEELRKYAVDVGRRVSLNFIHDSIAHLAALKIPPVPPGLGAMISQALASAFAPKPQPETPDADTRFEHAEQHEHVPGCQRVTPDPRAGAAGLDEGWLCCGCHGYNGVQRNVCRLCMHERCDIVTPPAPPASTPSDPSAH